VYRSLVTSTGLGGMSGEFAWLPRCDLFLSRRRLIGALRLFFTFQLLAWGCFGVRFAE
jgi:hypothetical protein